MQLHLTKCAKQHPDVKLEKCPFNGMMFVLFNMADILKNYLFFSYFTETHLMRAEQFEVSVVK